MPVVNGRFVPDWHQSAIAAAGATGDDHAEEPTKPKRATRKRGGKTADTAMLDNADSND